MAPVTHEGQKFKCNICGNEVMSIKVGGGDLYCCGQSMIEIAEDGQPSEA